MSRPLQPLREMRVPLSDQESEAVQILRFMESVRRRREREPYLREVAVRLLRGVDDHDQREQAARLLDFVKSKVKYVLDPNGSEYVRDPVLMVSEIYRHGEARGDCDDHALLLASLLGAIGMNARCVAVKIPEELPEGEDYYNHVIAQAQIAGEWLDLDPCAKQRPQQPYPDKLILEADLSNQTLDTLMNALQTLHAFSTPRPMPRRRPVNGYSAGFFPTDFTGWTNAIGGLFNTTVGGLTQLGVIKPGGNAGQIFLPAAGGGYGGGGSAMNQGGGNVAQGNGQLIPGVSNGMLIGGVVLLVTLPTILDAVRPRRRRD